MSFRDWFKKKAKPPETIWTTRYLLNLDYSKKGILDGKVTIYLQYDQFGNRRHVHEAHGWCKNGGYCLGAEADQQLSVWLNLNIVPKRATDVVLLKLQT